MPLRSSFHMYYRELVICYTQLYKINSKYYFNTDYMSPDGTYPILYCPPVCVLTY